MSVAILSNTTVINGNFVNINQFVKKKYESKRYKGTPKERKEVEKQIIKEIKELKESKNLFHLLETKGDSYSIKGVDLKSKEGIDQISDLSGKIQGNIKSMLGNVDEFDKSIAKMNWYMRFVLQMKNWTPRVYGNRVRKYQFDPEKQVEVLGMVTATTDAFSHGAMKTILIEAIKNLSPLLAYIHPVAGIVGYAASKYTRETVKYSINLQEAGKDAYNRFKLQREIEGRPTKQTQEEFTDMYINGIRNTLHHIHQITSVYMIYALAASMSSGGGSGDDKKWWVLFKLLFGVNKEVTGDVNPQSLTAILNGGFPVLGLLNNIVLFLKDSELETEGAIQMYVGNTSKGREKMKKAHPYYRFINLTEYRTAQNVLLMFSKDYSKFTGVKPQVPKK